MTNWNSRLPHIPAFCAACFALLSPGEQTIARLIKKMISSQPLNDMRHHQPNRIPLCQQQPVDPSEVN